ncbi:YidC/Oxa1 family membrane protein insertase [Gorillibacterium timonense]|uniref:YidC/Oxa1 family membrane protein insertase n=1 Tax=Gorillibacterium timonense TaxID=1689269 RepID=UPI0009E887A7
MVRRLYKLWPLALILLLAGCSTTNKDGSIRIISPSNGIWDRFFVGPLSEFLKYIAHLTGGAYGISILIVTIIVRFVVLPLTLKQYKSSKAMQALQPELAKIKEKYKDEPQKQQEETMKLFTQNNVNPMAGCFPIFIQMPVLIALYHAIFRTPEIRDHTFLWLQLGTPDHWILPIIAALTTFLQQKLMPKQQTAQMGAMQTIMLIFPVMIFFMSRSFPAALPLYWIYSNVFTIIQNLVIYRDKSGGTAVVTAGEGSSAGASAKKKSNTSAGAANKASKSNKPAGKSAKKPSK